MRCRSLAGVGVVVAGLLAACGERGTGSPIAGGAAAAREDDDAAARRAATPTEPAPRDETAAAVERLAAEWDEPPEGRSQEDVIRELAALGAEGLGRLIVFAATDPGEFRELVQDVAEALDDDAVPVFAKVLRERTGTARWIAACDIPRKWPWLASGPEVARALLVALEDDNVETRRQVLEQLGRAGPTGVEVTEAIVRRLDTVEESKLRFDDDSEADAAFDALKTLGPDAASAFGRVARHASTFGMFPEDHSDVLAAIGPATEEDRRLLVTFLRSDEPARRVAAFDCIAAHPEAVRGLAAEVLPHFGYDGSGDSEGLWRVLGELAAVPGIAEEFLASLPGLPEDRARHVVGVLAGSDSAEVRAAARAAAVGLLRSRSPDVRASAVRFLSPREGDPFDPEPLRPLLDDPYAEVRAAVAWLLCADPESEARASAVARELVSVPGDARFDAARVLALDVDAEKPPPEWVALLADDDSHMRQVVSESLATGRTPLGTAPPRVLRTLVEDALGEDRSESTPRTLVRLDGGARALLDAALEALRSDDVSAALRALEALAAVSPAVGGELREIRAAVGTREFAGDDDLRARWSRAMGALSGDVFDLSAAFRGDVEDARKLLALGEVGARAIVLRVGTHLRIDAGRVAEELRGEPRLRSAVLAAAEASGNEAESRALREGAALLASTLGAEQGIRLCVRLSRDPSEDVRLAALVGLEEISRSDNIDAAADALRAVLADEDENVRRKACVVAFRVSVLLRSLEERLADPVPAVRLQAAAVVLGRVRSDATARRTLLDVLATAKEEHRLYEAEWDFVGGALREIPLDASAAPVLAHALREVGDCGSQGAILRALPRLGGASAPALAAVRLALADELGCHWGWHDNPLVPDALAALAAMGAAAAPALPDLRAVAATDREHAEAARAAIRAIESATR